MCSIVDIKSQLKPQFDTSLGTQRFKHLLVLTSSNHKNLADHCTSAYCPQALPSLQLDLAEGATIATLLEAVTTSLSWQPTATLLRLPGFTEPWERAMCRGRELSSDSLLSDALKVAAAGRHITPEIVHVALHLFPACHSFGYADSGMD